jgi:pre-mRNA-splicing helicase BRR2
MLGQKMTEESFTKLVALSQKIDDYHEEQLEEDNDNMDDNMGVALIFDRDDDEEDAPMEDVEGEVDDLDVVRDEMDEQDDNDDDGDVVAANLGDVSGNNDGSIVSPMDVDAYWLQRQLNEFTKDAEASQKLADQTLTILQVRCSGMQCVVAPGLSSTPLSACLTSLL